MPAILGRITGALGKAAPNLLSIGEWSKNAIPKFENEVTVEVIGDPTANMAYLYKLALATAFGLVKNVSLTGRDENGRPYYITLPPGMLMIEYDAADRWVRCTLKYVNTVAVAAAGRGNRLEADFFRGNPLYSGPKEFTEGSDWNFSGLILPGLGGIPGIPNSAESKGLPALAFSNRNILTSDPTTIDPNPARPIVGNVIQSPNPKPPGDKRSRGTTYGADQPNGPANFRLIQLVFAALTNPGSPQQEVFAAPTTGTLGG